MDFSVLINDIPTLLGVVVGVPAVLVGYIVGTEMLVRLLPDKQRPRVRPWIWVAPAIILVGGFLFVPAILTFIQSFQDNHGHWVGFQNYVSQLAGFPSGNAWIAVRNSILVWLLLYMVLVLTFGLVMAVLFDRVQYETIVKSLIFMPMAISSVASGVIWKFMYWYQPPGQTQTGTLNAVVTFFHHDPVAWLQDQWPNGIGILNNLALISVATWGLTGFSMVILSAALKGIPGELLEAARVDGAGELTIFRRVIFPLMMPTIVVVATTLVIFAIKVFDVPYVMTNGLFNTDVLALRMYNLMYQAHDYANASAVAIVLLIAVVPVLVFNLRQFRAVEARR